MPEHSFSPTELEFPEDFIWGTGVSSFQVEGDSKKRNADWDVFIKKNGGIIKPDEIGAQWWREEHAEKDIDILAKLNIQSLRISLEWARIEPYEGKIDRAALHRYKALISHLKKKNITPLVALNHFSLPSWVAKNGGWQSTKIQRYFSQYVKRVVSEFSDISHWITINEPNSLVTAGYITHYFPPHKENILAALMARENMLICHEEAYRIIKKNNPLSIVGMSIAIRWYRPDNPNSLKERLYTKLVNYLSSLNYVDATKNSCDFIGCNFYTGYYLDLAFKQFRRRMRRDAADVPDTILFGETKRPDAYLSDMGWPIVPDFFLDTLRSLHNTYNKPIIITENGIADEDDNYRAFYILTHLTAIWKALQENIPVKGYFYWSAIDNLEWLYGYDKRFGLIEVNPVTGERKARKSAALYKEICQKNYMSLKTLSQEYLPENQQESARTVFHTLLKTSAHGKCSYCL